MKVDQNKVAYGLAVIIDFLFVALLLVNVFKTETYTTTIDAKIFYSEGKIALMQASEQADQQIQQKILEEQERSKIVYDNMTMEQLSAKLERSMNSTLNGKGELFATYSIKLGLDPYLALAIVLHETGCSYSCSGLVQTNNNIGGLKGSNGKYLYFNTIDEGIKGYLDILYKRYYSKGLTTPELMNPVYAQSTTWASRVNWYIKKIKAN